MTDEELIKCKSDEINRLRKVCRGKDMQLERAISALQLACEYISDATALELILSDIESLRNSIG